MPAFLSEPRTSKQMKERNKQKHHSNQNFLKLALYCDEESKVRKEVFQLRAILLSESVNEKSQEHYNLMIK